MSYQHLPHHVDLEERPRRCSMDCTCNVGNNCMQASVCLVLIAPNAFPGSAAQVFLITDKDATPGVFAALSVNLRKYRYVFADIHASDKAALQRLSITKARRRRTGARFTRAYLGPLCLFTSSNRIALCHKSHQYPLYSGVSRSLICQSLGSQAAICMLNVHQ